MTVLTSKEKILGALLRQMESDPEGYLSGEALSAQCEVSRAAVWKQIKNLQQEGYEIASQHGMGYRLTGRADRFYAGQILQGLEPGFISKRQEILCYGSLDSTNIEAKRLALAGKGHGTVLLTEEQTAGKGRLGRPWVSLPGTGIWTSLILQPEMNIEQISRYSFVIAVAVAEGIRQATALPAEIKWPNDILIDGKKVCGILLELMAEENQVDYLIIGFGINANQRKADFPADVQQKATSLAIAAGHAVDRTAVLCAVLNAIQRNDQLLQTQGFAAVREKWQELSCVIGRDVVLTGAGLQPLNGTVKGIDEDGALLLQTDKGIERILSGDLSLRAVGSNYM